jgi:ribosomal protein S11
MFAEALAYTIRFKQTVFRLVGKGRSRIKPFSREFKKWGIRVFYVINRIRRPFNGCKFPHTRRI